MFTRPVKRHSSHAKPSAFEVAPGECVCLLGRNGVGKATNIRSIMGLTPRDITGKAPHQIAQAGIGFVPEDRRIFADLTVWENLDVASRDRGGGGWTVERVFEYTGRGGPPSMDNTRWVLQRLDVLP